MREQLIAYVREDDDIEPIGRYHHFDRWLTGRFSADVGMPDETVHTVHELELDAALAWARERAARVLLTFEDEVYDAGEVVTGEYERWTPRPVERRRPPEERWKNRTPDDPPIAWNVEVMLGRDDLDPLFGERERLDREVAAIAANAGVVAVDATSVDGFVADVRRAEQRAGGAESFGWTSTHPPVWRLRCAARAPTRRQAEAEALARVGELPAGWTVEAVAAPAG